jgi:hypothetical protein
VRSKRLLCRMRVHEEGQAQEKDGWISFGWLTDPCCTLKWKGAGWSVLPGAVDLHSLMIPNAPVFYYFVHLTIDMASRRDGIDEDFTQTLVCLCSGTTA